MLRVALRSGTALRAAAAKAPQWRTQQRSMSFVSRAAGAVFSPKGLIAIGGVGVAGFAIQLAGAGEAQDFFEYTFVLRDRDPDAITDFYSTEDFLQILGIFPFAIHFVLAGVEWDTDTENQMQVWDSMQISFDITELETEVDGEEVTKFFNKRERFVNYVPLLKRFGLPILLWDQVQNFGYQRQPDGSLLVRHHGESFLCPWPIKYGVMLHARYVAWATEKHFTSEIFATDDLEAREAHRSNIPLVAFKSFVGGLKKKQEEAMKAARAKGESTVALEKNLEELKRLERKSSVVTVKRRSSNLKVSIDDKEGQEAVRNAIRSLSMVGGAEAVADDLQKMLGKAGMTEAKHVPKRYPTLRED